MYGESDLLTTLIRLSFISLTVLEASEVHSDGILGGRPVCAHLDLMDALYTTENGQ